MPLEDRTCKPGEFRGADNKLYVWVNNGKGYDLEVYIEEPKDGKEGIRDKAILNKEDAKTAFNAYYDVLEDENTEHIPLLTVLGGEEGWELLIKADEEYSLRNRITLNEHKWFEKISILAGAAYQAGLERGARK